MNKNILIGVVVVLVLAGLAFWVMSRNNNDTDNKNLSDSKTTETTLNEDEKSEVVLETPEYDQEDQLIVEESTLTYSAERIVGNSHTGTVSIKSGVLYEQNDFLVGGEFVVDMNTITESKNNQMMLNHMRSDDFFNVEEFPETKFIITSIEDIKGIQNQITGNLTIKGQTHEISFPATIEVQEDKILAKADFDIDRTKWGITYDSGSIFQQLGDKAIRDEINFKLDLVFNR